MIVHLIQTSVRSLVEKVISPGKLFFATHFLYLACMLKYSSEVEYRLFINWISCQIYMAPCQHAACFFEHKGKIKPSECNFVFVFFSFFLCYLYTFCVFLKIYLGIYSCCTILICFIFSSLLSPFLFLFFLFLFVFLSFFFSFFEFGSLDFCTNSCYHYEIWPVLAPVNVLLLIIFILLIVLDVLFL